MLFQLYEFERATLSGYKKSCWISYQTVIRFLANIIFFNLNTKSYILSLRIVHDVVSTI